MWERNETMWFRVFGLDRGYYVSTAGRDEEVVREYIRNQEAEDQRIDQLDLLRKLATICGAQLSAAFAALSGSHILIPPALPGDT